PFDDLPDRSPHPGRRAGPGPAVRRARALARRARGAGRRRVRYAVSRQAALGRPPAPLVVLAGVAATLLVVPLLTLVVDTPWGSFLTLLGSDAVLDALRITA